MAIDFLFFFQAEDGIRDPLVTGVQTCALPIWPACRAPRCRHRRRRPRSPRDATRGPPRRPGRPRPPRPVLAWANGSCRAVQEAVKVLVRRGRGRAAAAAAGRVADLVAGRLRSGDWLVERRRHRPGQGAPALGDVLIGRRRGGLARDAGGRRLLLLAHMDTVFDDGEAASRPFRTSDGRAYGPGVIDDKAGLVAGIEAIETLCDDIGFEEFTSITLVCSPAEEIGSPFSKEVIRALAREHDIAIGLEAARTNGDLVSARKGVAVLVVEVAGRASHAGVRPERGASAALEAAHKTVALHGLNRRWAGVTCNVGTVRAGTRPNVVAAR